ncbi:hypothetical protein AB0D42_30785 [Streptomyces sp. NPDC048304]|jgi:hypothetical protein|uniref:hypothetical protein n=1 Tax=Streptomyces sp. NPDC048304 TaxID=3154820 RepID=UPI0033E08ADE
MHTSRLLLRSGPALAAAAVLPVALAGPSAAAAGISVSTTGSTVSVVTSACSEINGTWGTAALLTAKQSTVGQGRQAPLAGTTVRQSAAWKGVSPGTYTVVVVCSNGSAAGSQAVIVSSGAGSKTAATASPAPARGVLSGLGGAARHYGPLTLGVGAAVVGTGIVATGWYLRRRAKPYRL